MTNTTPLKLVIVGGVAGGASAAARARRMNEHAEIILLEKDRDVSFANCGLPYYLGGEITDRNKLTVASADLLRKRFRIDVRTMTEAVAINRDARTVTVTNHTTNTTEDLPYDKVILAPGASPIRPPVGCDQCPGVFTLRNLHDTDDIHDHLDRIDNKHALVVGGGYIGIEMAEQLVERGHPVTLVERAEQVLALLDPEMAQPGAKALTDNGIDLRTSDEVVNIERSDNTIHATLKSGATLDVGIIIFGIGVIPNTKLATDAGLDTGQTRGITVDRYMRTSDPDIYAVGDAVEYVYGPTGQSMRIALAGPANRAGRIAGEHAVTGESQPMGDVFGTSIVRVFNVAAGLTGLTARSAERFGIDANTVTVIANHHAGYFPGAKPVTLKLTYAPDTGKVLGAQAVGEQGIDKRLDVIATLMAMNGTVRDLANLDLAYAPPFGSAKDVLHMAAFAASNQLDGFDTFLPANTDLADDQVVDVRTDAEVAKSPLPAESAVTHIPLDDLRDRLGELDADRPTVVSCASGLRSHVAARILLQNNFKAVFELSGGATIRNRAVASQPANA
ncbi:FAD-dependent oxidoreductase [Mucisphaera calidilacus]|uniref:Coenzyme A disulfide reductase n=1 Tax=Mucisphaera calidilacus TaxID=2527982 RepID=A0A518BWM4_9BACT|nr:FAD-dependent oxidoreductase [Mucisphaera calidilacus]QDU71383.1 Coenzyme A disulfide reductase [Mucisphaera calidilacus]